MSKLSNNTNRNWYAKTEVLLVATSIGSSVAAIVFQQIAFAAITSIPLSLAIGFNSSNRKRLEEVERQHKATIIQLEQKFLEKQESTNNVLYSLPTRFDLLKIEKGLEDYNNTFTEQLNNLDERQTSVNLKPQQIDSDCQQFTEIQQRLYHLETLLKSYNLTLSNNTIIQQTVASIEGKIEKLEKQFNNLTLPDFQDQLKQLQQVVEKLQISNTESRQANKYFSEKIQDINHKVQSVNNKIQELSLTHIEIQNRLNPLKDIDFEKISSKTEFLSTMIDTDFQLFRTCFEEKIKVLEERNVELLLCELQQRLAKLEQLVNKPYINANKNSERHSVPGISCNHCRQAIKEKYVMGGEFNNYKFHLDCKYVYEKKHL